MELKVYNGEHFERWTTWYLVFAVVISLVIIASVFSSNITGAILVFVLAGWYIYYLTTTNDVVQMKIWKNALQIWKWTLPWSSLYGFVLEYHTWTEKIHNIVLLMNGKNDKKEYRIYTIADTAKNLENFVNELYDYLPMLDKYDQSTFEKFIRKIKM